MAKRKKHKKKKRNKNLEIPTLPAREPISWLGISVRVWILHLAMLIVYMIFAAIGHTFMYGNKLYSIVSMISLIFYLAVCYIIALRSGHRDNAYEAETGIQVSKWQTIIGSLIAQCPGFIIAIALQFLKEEGSMARMVYAYLYMAFDYPVSLFEHVYRVVFFIPPLFSPIIMVCAYFTGRTAELKERRPSERMIRLGARVSGVIKSREKKKK